MIKPIIKILGIFLLALAAFMFGANQYRIRSWPFDQGLFRRIAGKLDEDKDKDKKQKIGLWVENLKKGGYIPFLRHASREKWPEVGAFDVYEFASNIKDASETSFKRAVCLSEQGIEEAKLIGKIFQLAKIPTGLIVSSPSCRAKQTATYAFGKYDYVNNSIRFPDSQSEKPARESADHLITLLQNVEIKPGTNTIITGHGLNLNRLAGRGIVENSSVGDTSGLLETGFYVIERRSGNKLAVVFSINSILDLTSAYTGTVVGSR